MTLISAGWSQRTVRKPAALAAAHNAGGTCMGGVPGQCGNWLRTWMNAWPSESAEQ